MKLKKAFNSLKETDHTKSFDQLDEWLDQNTQKSNNMKSIYKVAASFLITAMIFVACSIPVEHEEEIGYMIKGMAEIENSDLKSKLMESGLDLTQISMNDVLHEEIGKPESAQILKEIVMVLPEANIQLANDTESKLASVFNFKTINIMPIEDKVERTMFESALKKVNLEFGEDVSDEQMKTRINEFIHENSQSVQNVDIMKDENGVRKAVFVIRFETNEEGEANYFIEREEDTDDK